MGARQQRSLKGERRRYALISAPPRLLGEGGFGAPPGGGAARAGRVGGCTYRYRKLDDLRHSLTRSNPSE